MENLEERRSNYMRRLDNFNQEAMKKNRSTPREIVIKGIEKSTGITESKVLDGLVDKVMNNKTHAEDVNYDVFLFGIAESLESIRCETTSQNEYFTWIDDAKKIMDHLQDGHVSFRDVREKESFVKMSWQRETELLTCLALYEKSNHPLAKERHAELMIKLQRLRQIRSALLVGTKSRPDRRILSPEERARLALYGQTLQDMEDCDAAGDYHNLALEKQMQDLQMSHAHDVEFSYAGYSFYQWMLEEQHRAEMERENRAIENLYSYLNRPDEYLDIVRHRDDTRENIVRRIQELTGRHTGFRHHSQMMNIRSNVQTFEAQRYKKLLEESREIRS